MVTAFDVTAARGDFLQVDLTCAAPDAERADQITKALAAVEGVTVGKVSDRTFLLHLGGKIEVQSKVPLKTRDDLSMAYTPGVARVCRAIVERPGDVRRLTIKRNTVAVVTDGSAVLGLGNLGPEAALPVMEGKAALFKRFANIDAWPICLATQDPDEIVRTVELIAPVFGGINLEDIAAPKCFEIEARLRERLDIPVFHDDQHGTAIVVLAALTNALRVVGKRLSDVRIALSGAGAAGTAILNLLLAAGATDIVVGDVDGVVHLGRPGLDQSLRELAEKTNHRGFTGHLREALAGADVFIGVSAPDVLDEARRRLDGRRRGRVRPRQSGPRDRPARRPAPRQGGRHRAQRLPEPDQQRARLPRRVPRAARCPEPNGAAGRPARRRDRVGRRGDRRRAARQLHRPERVPPRPRHARSRPR